MQLSEAGTHYFQKSRDGPARRAAQSLQRSGRRIKPRLSWSFSVALVVRRRSASVLEFALRARMVVVMVFMIVMVDFALFGSREIGPGREPLIDCHGWRDRQSRHRGAEQCRA